MILVPVVQEAGLVYFVQPVDGGPIKIGTTENIDARLKQLEAYYGCRLVVLATRPGGFEVEREVHRRFAHLRLGRTEQFRAVPELLVYLGIVPKGEAKPLKPGARIGQEGIQNLTLVRNLCRLGVAKVEVHTSEISHLVREKTGKNLNRKAISKVMRSARIPERTIQLLAEAIGVDPSELLKPIA